MKKYFKRLFKLAEKDIIEMEIGTDGVETKKKSIQIDFIEISKKSKLFKKGNKFLNKYFSKKLKRKVLLVEHSRYSKSILYSLHILKKG